MKILQRHPRLGRIYDRFVRIRGNPHEISLGAALGLYLGMTPFLGFHILVALFLAALFKWNKIAAGVGAWITNPVTAPVIYGINWFVGAKMTGIELTRVVPDDLGVRELTGLMQSGPHIIWTLLVGGLINGLPLAVGGYFLARLVLTRFRSGANESSSKKRAV